MMDVEGGGQGGMARIGRGLCPAVDGSGLTDDDDFTEYSIT